MKQSMQRLMALLPLFFAVKRALIQTNAMIAAVRIARRKDITLVSAERFRKTRSVRDAGSWNYADCPIQFRLLFWMEILMLSDLDGLQDLPSHEHYLSREILRVLWLAFNFF